MALEKKIAPESALALVEFLKLLHPLSLDDRRSRPATYVARLTGTHIRCMDLKGRVSLPLQFAEVWNYKVVVTRLPLPGLLLMGGEDWEALCSQYLDYDLFRGHYIAHAHEALVEQSTRRFLVPHVLREYSGVRPLDDVAIVGLGDRYAMAVGVDRWESWADSLNFQVLTLLREELKEGMYSRPAPEFSE